MFFHMLFSFHSHLADRPVAQSWVFGWQAALTIRDPEVTMLQLRDVDVPRLGPIPLISS